MLTYYSEVLSYWMQREICTLTWSHTGFKPTRQPIHDSCLKVSIALHMTNILLLWWQVGSYCIPRQGTSVLILIFLPECYFKILLETPVCKSPQTSSARFQKTTMFNQFTIWTMGSIRCVLNLEDVASKSHYKSQVYITTPGSSTS